MANPSRRLPRVHSILPIFPTPVGVQLATWESDRYHGSQSVIICRLGVTESLLTIHAGNLKVAA
jgi:hypothetical protein